MERLPSLRASDSDREQAAERLRRATVEGRLSAEELEERLGSLFSARTYGEINALLADLPASQIRAQPRVPAHRWAGALGALTLMLAVLGMLAGAREHSAVAVQGTDRFRHSEFRGPFAYSHHALALAMPVVGVVAALLVCAALVWVLAQLRRTTRG